MKPSLSKQTKTASVPLSIAPERNCSPISLMAPSPPMQRNFISFSSWLVFFFFLYRASTPDMTEAGFSKSE